MFLDCEPPIAAGREIWGFPKKFAHPVFKTCKDTIVGTLEYAGQTAAVGTMTYKYEEIEKSEAIASLSKPACNLKIIPGICLLPFVYFIFFLNTYLCRCGHATKIVSIN